MYRRGGRLTMLRHELPRQGNPLAAFFLRYDRNGLDDCESCSPNDRAEQLFIPENDGPGLLARQMSASKSEVDSST